MLVVEHLIWRQQLFLELLYRYTPVCLLVVLIFFLGVLWKIVFDGKSLFFYLNQSQGQGCPRHWFLGCHDHHCLLHVQLWASAWASGTVQKVVVYHWALWPHSNFYIFITFFFFLGAVLVATTTTNCNTNWKVKKVFSVNQRKYFNVVYIWDPFDMNSN